MLLFVQPLPFYVSEYQYIWSAAGQLNDSTQPLHPLRKLFFQGMGGRELGSLLTIIIGAP